ncbi:MAG: carotenoid biosynthesis protein [Anaerolineales bacterium]|nr:carotenoid biosynthesis protein [Anaerolineales bacterium]
MLKERDGNAPFYYLLIITVISVILIVLNVLLDMRIPFTVSFLIGYVGALLVFVVWHAWLTKGWRRSLLMLSLSFVIAFTAEALGVNFGLVFGNYHYTPLLGVQLFGVPLLAALAWEPIVYAAFCMTDILSPLVAGLPKIARVRSSMIWLAAAGALATTAWDMMIDPIAVSQGWWVWEEGGPYVPYVANGVPIQNFLGWLGVAFVINLLYRWIADRNPQPRRTPSLTLYGPLTLYISLFLTSFGVSITILDRPEVALIGVLAMGPFVVIGLANVGVDILKEKAWAPGD